jgi:hypothetical protein
VETLLSKLKIELIHGDPYAYHNAIELERLGYFYTSGKERMLEIHHEFRPEGKLLRRLDGATPFRQAGMEKTIRGRSWAIHDGILEQPWICPSMVKLVGRQSRDFTFPDAIYVPQEATPNPNIFSTIPCTCDTKHVKLPAHPVKTGQARLELPGNEGYD